MKTIKIKLLQNFILILLILLLQSCSTTNVKPKKLYQICSGKWAIICENNFSDKYAEIDFINERELNSRTEATSSGYDNYLIKGDSLIIGTKIYQYIPISDTKMELINENNKFTCYKISFTEISYNSEISYNNDQIDPFYLRRAFYLVKEGFMTKSEANDYINGNRWITVDSIHKK